MNACVQRPEIRSVGVSLRIARTYGCPMELTASATQAARARLAPAVRTHRSARDRGLDAGVRRRRVPRAEQRRLRHDRAQRGRRGGLVDRSARRPSRRAAARHPARRMGRHRPAGRLRRVDRTCGDVVGERGAQHDRARAGRRIPRRARARDRAAGPNRGPAHDQRRRLRDRLRDAAGRPVAPASAVVSRQRPPRVPRCDRGPQAQLSPELLERARGVRGDGRAAAARRRARGTHARGPGCRGRDAAAVGAVHLSDDLARRSRRARCRHLRLPGVRPAARGRDRHARRRGPRLGDPAVRGVAARRAPGRAPPAWMRCTRARSCWGWR